MRAFLRLTRFRIIFFLSSFTALSRAVKAPPNGHRLPPGHHYNHHFLKSDCETGRLCVGPRHDHYPIGHEPGVLFASRFVVPPLPKAFDSVNMTYYDYFNIYFRQHPKGGYFNQFVPQLMLGNVLANSTNAPDYQPIWEVLKEWHIGAQYFFALLCKDSSAHEAGGDPCSKYYAATGKLVRVLPGEVIETTFELVQVSDKDDTADREWEWHLRMGVVGAHPNRWSLVVARRPYMGLVPNTQWKDDNYINVTVGSCLENYGMVQSENYPQTWEIDMDIITPRGSNLRGRENDEPPTWDDWIIAGGQKCSWLPQSTVKNVQGSNWQRATWNATLQQATSMGYGDKKRSLSSRTEESGSSFLTINPRRVS